MEEIPRLPQTIDEAASAMLAALAPTEREAIRALGSDVDTWFLAAWARANFDLWSRDGRTIFNVQVVTTGDDDKDLAMDVAHPHPDDISEAIVQEVLKRLRAER